jgi:hypothetical protein
VNINNNDTIMAYIKQEMTEGEQRAETQDVVDGDEPAPVFSQPTIDDTIHATQSGVNGAGLWSSWQRNFRSPELAVLDLFDNAIDATLRDEDDTPFGGKIEVYSDVHHHNPDGDDDTPTRTVSGICLKNNCAEEIPSLELVLEAYGSTKGNEQIGENGVGIKQACAALSDLSIVITKNVNQISIGLLSKALQTPDRLVLPSYKFEALTLQRDLDKMLFGDADFHRCIEEYGNGDAQVGRERIERHIETLFYDDNGEDHVFLVILHRILHRATGGGIKGLLKNLALTLPKNYLHIPPEFCVTVDSQRLLFQYWERRLAELHYFPILVDSHHSYKLALDWHEPHTAHIVKIFLGFDPERAASDSNNKASLLVYSRKSGRLVKEEDDARGRLSLVNSGTDYAQGLTVIVDDSEGRLPLTPTKQDIAFGRETHGKIHEANLYAWVGAFAHCYWQHFFTMFKTKQALGVEVASHIDEVRDFLAAPTVPASMREFDKFSTFENMSFTIYRKTNNIRCIRSGAKLYHWKADGVGTQIRFTKVAPPPAKKPAAKKARKPQTTTPKKRRKQVNTPRKSIPDEDSSSSSDEDNEEEELLSLQMKYSGLQQVAAGYRLKCEEHEGIREKCRDLEEEVDKLRKKCTTHDDIVQAHRDIIRDLKQTNQSLSRLAGL